MAATSEAFSALIKRLSRTSLEFVIFEALLKEAAEPGEKCLHGRMMRMLALQEADAAAPPASAPTPRAPLPKDKSFWVELDESEQAAARALGFTHLAWDEGIQPEPCSKRWNLLSERERSAATLLGYEALGWDSEVDEAVSSGVPQPSASVVATAPPVPTVAPAPAPLAPPDGPLAKDKASWSELSEQEQSSARALGYNELGWNEGIAPESCSTRWASLAAEERAAAMRLGYNQPDWDAELEEEEAQLLPATNARPSAAGAPAATAVAPTPPASWRGARPAAPAPAAPTAPTAATAPIKGKDKHSWDALTQQEMLAAAALGYNKEDWDEGVAPERCSRVWSALTASDRRAAQQLGYSASVWDREYEESMAVEPGASEAAAPSPARARSRAAPAALASRAPNAMAEAPTAVKSSKPANAAAKAAAAKASQAATSAEPAAQRAAPEPSGKTKVWADLNPKERRAANVLGFSSKSSWDDGASTGTLSKPWQSLSDSEKRAATILGYAAEDWDAELTGPPAQQTDSTASKQPRPQPKAAKKGAGAVAASPGAQVEYRVSLPEEHSSGGAVFGCTYKTKDECMSRQLLGLPGGHKKMIDGIRPHATALFLFNYSKREMYGVFEADAPGGMNLVPDAWWEQGSWRNGKAEKGASPFPAQVHFKIVYHFMPLPESRFKHIMKYQPNSNRFQFNLEPAQVAELMNAFKAYDNEKRSKE